MSPSLQRWWRSELARRFGSANPFRYFVAPLAVTGIGLCRIVGGPGLAMQLQLLTSVLLGLTSHALLVVFAWMRSADAGLLVGLRYLLVLPCTHSGFGVGFILGCLRHQYYRRLPTTNQVWLTKRKWPGGRWSIGCGAVEQMTLASRPPLVSALS